MKIASFLFKVKSMSKMREKISTFGNEYKQKKKTTDVISKK